MTGLSGSTVTAVTPVQGRSIFYVNNKPYKVNADGAQDTFNGVWTRGSAINNPSPIAIQGTGIVSNSSEGVADRFSFTTGGFLSAVQPGQTLLISGKASVTVNLPDDALDARTPITVEGTLDKAGFLIKEVQTDVSLIVDVFDQTLVLESREDPSRDQLIAQLGTDKIGIVAKVPVTYKKAAGGTGTLNVFIPFNGQISFEVRDMRTNTETLCQSCHTQGQHRYTKWGKKKDKTFIGLSPTHNKNIGGQYRKSGHANKQALPFSEFSSFAFGSTHQPSYPFDMSITGSGGLNSLRNKGNNSFKLTSTNPANIYFVTPNTTNQEVLINNYACNQCHHGLGSIDYMKDRQGTSSAQVLWGDATVVCLTCHETHKDPNGSGKNVRVPVKLSFNSRFVDAAKNPGGGINKFIDGTDLPATLGKSNVCLFCHQGRESGLTVYLAIKGKVDPYTNSDKVIDAAAGVSFINPHYLDSGAMLWSRNAWEFFFGTPSAPQSYSTGIPSHQQTNCTGCHMAEASADNSEGGHTWKPKVETCQSCHGVTITSFQSRFASADYDGDGIVKTVYEEIGTINPDTGLFGQLKAALDAKGISYAPDTYPYFNAKGTSSAFRAWTSNTLAAAFNLAYAYKAGNAAYVHNAWYLVQILQDSLKALGATQKPWVRPPGDRNATDYRTIVVNP